MALNKNYDPFDGLFDLNSSDKKETTTTVEKAKAVKKPKAASNTTKVKAESKEKKTSKATKEELENKEAPKIDVPDDFMNPPEEAEEQADNTQNSKATQTEEASHDTAKVEPEQAQELNEADTQIEAEVSDSAKTETSDSIKNEQAVTFTAESNEVINEKNQEAFDLADLRKEFPEDGNDKYLLSNSVINREDLQIGTYGGALSKDKLRKLERYATKTGMGRDSVITQILLNNYESEKLLDDDQIDQIIDDYEANSKKNSRITYRTRVFLKKFLNDRAQEYGINISVLFRYYVLDFLASIEKEGN